MKVTIITPYTGSGAEEDAYRPLSADVVEAPFRDVTGRRMTTGLPLTNLYIVEMDLTGQQVAAFKSDDRFFVLEPGPGYSGSALKTWLDGKGAQGHGVTESSTAAEVLATLPAYFRAL